MPLPKPYYVVNDFILVQPAEKQEHKTESGIITMTKMQIVAPSPEFKQPEIIRGYVMLKGDGYPIGQEEDSLTNTKSRSALYIPLRVEIGDEVYFLRIPPVIEIRLEGNPYFLIKQGHILVAQSSNLE